MKKIVSPHSNVSLDQRVTPYGPKCQLCGCQGSVLIDEGSGLPSITRPLFIVPECGHSLCRKCRQRSIEENYCRVCWPHGGPKDTPKTTNPSFQQNLITNGLLVSRLPTLFEFKSFGAIDQLLPTSSNARGNRRMHRKPPAMNAMMIGNAAALSLDDLSLSCLKCSATATLICDHCFVLLCENCFNYMHFESKESHQGINISPRSNESVSSCTVHMQKITGRCLDCKSDVCSDCILENKHQGHTFEKIDAIRKQEGGDPVTLSNSLKMYLDNVNNSVNLMDSILGKFESYVQRKSDELNMVFMKLFAKLQVHLRQQQMLLDKHAQKKFQELKETRDCFVKVQEYLNGLDRVSLDSGWGPNSTADANFVRFSEMLTVFASVPLCLTALFDNLENFVDLKNFDCSPVLSSIGPILCNDTSDIVFPVFASEIGSSGTSSFGTSDFNPNSILKNRKEVKDLITSVTSNDPNKSLTDVQRFDLIKITHLKSPKDFFFIEIAAEQELERLNDKILKLVCDPSANMSKPTSLSDLKPEQFVLARFNIDNRWYRAKIIRHDPKSTENPNSSCESEGGVLVKFIDYGNTAMCHLQDVLVPSHQYQLHTMKPLCSHGSLYNVEPRSFGRAGKSGQIWSKASTMFFKRMVENRNLLVNQSFVNDESGTVALDLYEHIQVSDKWTLNGDYPASLSRALVFSRLAVFESGEACDVLKMSGRYEIPKVSVFNPADSPFITAAVTEVVSPSNFYCRLLTKENKQDELLESINSFIDKCEEINECRIWYPYVGMYCLAQFPGDDGSVFYYRANVIKVLSPSNITVFFIDFGNCNQVKIDQMRKIPHHFLMSFPNVLIQCKLDGVVPLSRNLESVWSEDFRTKFRCLILDKYVKLKVVSVSDEDSDEVYCVKVLIESRRRGKDIDLSEFLIAQNLVQSAEEINNHLVPETTDIFTDVHSCAIDNETNDGENNGKSVSVGDQMRKVLVSHVVDPWNLYVRKFNSNDKDPILEVEHAIDYAVIEGQVSEKCPPNTDEILFVRVESQSTDSDSMCLKRCRVIAEELSESGDSNIRDAVLIDEGSTISVKLNEVLSYTCNAMNPILQQPGLALKCALTVICPAGSVDGNWSKNSIEALQRVTADNEIYVDPNLEAADASDSSEVIFRELYHIDPSSPKEAIVRNGTDFVPVSFFLKLNGFAIPNKVMRAKLNTPSLDKAPALDKQQVKHNTSYHNLSVQPEDEMLCSQSTTPFSTLSPTSSEKSVPKSGSYSLKPCEMLWVDAPPTTDKQTSEQSLSKAIWVSPKLSPEVDRVCQMSTENAKRCKKGVDLVENKPSVVEKGQEKCHGVSEKHSPNSTNSGLGASFSDSDSDENTAPTVLFMPKTKGVLKTQTSNKSCITSNAKAKDVDFFEPNSSFIDDLELNSEHLKLDEKAASSKSVEAKIAAKNMIKFETESSISPEPVPKTEILKQVRMWAPSKTDACQSTTIENTIHFDLSHHGIPEFSSLDEVGDKQVNLQILPNVVYKACIIPSKSVFPFQFEQFDSDGISLRGCCKDFNQFLIHRINSEIDEFLRGKYPGGGYDENELYSGMAACGFFREDGHWYRVRFLKKDGGKFLVRFVDFGNDVRCNPEDFFPVPAFIEVPQLCMECVLEGVRFTERNLDAKSHTCFAAKLKEAILNENHPVFVSMKEMPTEETDQRKSLPISVYYEGRELRHYLVHQGYLQWEIDTDHDFLQTDADKEMYETLVKCVIPFNIKFLQSLIGETIEVQVTHQVSSNFIMGRVIKPNPSAVNFEKFISSINYSQPIVTSRLRATDETVGQLVYVYNRELHPHVWNRGQVIGYVPRCPVNDLPFKYTIHLIDYGYSENLPVSMSITDVHNIEKFVESPAEAVPFVFSSAPENEKSTPVTSAKFEKEQLIQIQVESVGKIVQCSIKN